MEVTKDRDKKRLILIPTSPDYALLYVSLNSKLM